MGWLVDLIGLGAGEYGWLTILGFIAYQLWFPKHFHPSGGTTLQQIVDGLRDDLHADMEKIKTRMEEYGERQLHIIQIQRANARTNPRLNEDRVDEYLWENGVNPDDFIVEAATDGGRPEDFETDDADDTED